MLKIEESELKVQTLDGDIIQLRDPSRDEVLKQEEEMGKLEEDGDTRKIFDVMDEFVLGLGFPEEEYKKLSMKAQQRVYKYCLGVDGVKKQ